MSRRPSRARRHSHGMHMSSFSSASSRFLASCIERSRCCMSFVTPAGRGRTEREARSELLDLVQLLDFNNFYAGAEADDG